ncbi:MAG: addiction module antidote protein [Sedimenticola sp.]
MEDKHRLSLKWLSDGCPDDSQLLLVALGDVVRATKNIAEFSREVGVSRETLYKALSKNGNPRYSSLTGILHSLGLGLSARPLHQ